MNDKRIAQNAIMLYMRQFLTMAVGLYTSRVILSTLGASDYGVYTLVGGFVSMLAYLNSVFVSATQRFISYELGTLNKEKLRDIFSTSLTIHYVLGIIILLLAETFGIWFINNYLNIEATRLVAAHWVFQCSLISMLISIFSVPYNSCIIAHEHMHVYAYISIIEVLMKLGVVFLLVISPYDYLITYAVLMVFVSIIIRLCYTMYCKRHFEECHYNKVFDRNRFREMSSYAGWTAIGTLGFTVKEQISNIILNQFFGTVINAARGFAGQINALINTFASNVYIAIAPQITKQYAAGNIEGSKNLVYVGAKYSFYLLSFVFIPIFVNMRYLLSLWLKEVPEYTCEFLIITMLATLLNSFANSVTTALQAIGKIKIFQIGIAVIMLLELPIAYILLENGYSPPFALLPAIATSLLGVVFRFIILHRLLPQYSFRYYMVNIVTRCLFVFCVSFVICSCLCYYFVENLINLVLTILICITINSFIICFVGLQAKERSLILQYVKSKIISR